MAANDDPKIRIRRDLYERLDAVADEGRKSGVTRTGIAEEAIEQWLARRSMAPGANVGTRATVPQPAPVSTHKHAKEHAALDVILDSGVLPYIRAIIYNLDGWSNAAKGVFPPGVAEGMETREIMDPGEIIAEIEELTGKPLEGSNRKRKRTA